MTKNSIHFEISERKVLLRLFDILFIGAALYGVETLFAFDYFTVVGHWESTVVLSVYIWGFGTVFELYDLKKSSRIETVFPSIILTASVSVLVFLLTPYFTPVLPSNRLQILYFYLAILGALVVWRIVYITFISSPRFYKRVLLIGETSTIENIVEAFKAADPNYSIIGFVNCKGGSKDSVSYKGLPEFAPEKIETIVATEGISEIVIATYNSEVITPDIYAHLLRLLEQGFPIREYTQVYEDMTYRVPVQYVGKDFYKYFPFSRSNTNTFYLSYKRLMDVVLSCLGLLSSLFFLPIIFLGNILGNRGTLFYKQERVGQHGKVFTIFKFRTMVKNAEENGAAWAQKNDARVTRFGAFLRATRIDEIPQFINILKGEMSFIGPRPERPVFVKELSKVIPFYQTRHVIKPGLTGWSQVNARYGSSIDDSLVKLQYDLYYIKHRSFFLDINISLKTFSTVIFFRGQ
ncbi:sugar transferase [Bizionia gelidisalsuginis]|uniref:Sugar transferase n=1 Tax=Bizionia gelidisalsuginis TaxID=291188 RepID=A0ABY3MDI7_9FLAO|nr:sugar transferase [Bizionia gelidisalsuginis]TYC16997.1 sugar transferase [Bizionia gelidisalsuginis]